MENVMTNGFAELSVNEMEMVDGGGFKAFAAAFVGTVCLAWTPVGCVAGGAGIGLGMFSAGCTLLDYACNNPNA